MAGQFPDRGLRLKPYPIEDGELDTDDLREFYADRGFEDSVPDEDDEAWDRWEYMTRPALADPQPGAGDRVPPGTGRIRACRPRKFPAGTAAAGFPAAAKPAARRAGQPACAGAGPPL